MIGDGFRPGGLKKAGCQETCRSAAHDAAPSSESLGVRVHAESANKIIPEDNVPDNHSPLRWKCYKVSGSSLKTIHTAKLAGEMAIGW
jgi:hypothetical protein